MNSLYSKLALVLFLLNAIAFKVDILHSQQPRIGRENKLLPSDGKDEDYFGTSVAISGAYAIIGAPQAMGVGAAYIYKLDGSDWVETQKLVPSNPVPFGDFGFSVDIEGSVAVVGTLSGSASIFEFDGFEWTERQKLLSSSFPDAGGFGRSVSLSGRHLMIGAPHADGSQGSAYIFEYDGSEWINPQILLPEDPPLLPEGALLLFGLEVSIDGNLAIVGTPEGVAFAFSFDGSKWDQQILKPSDNTTKPYSSFGRPVSISGNRAFIGRQEDDINGATNSGSVYYFEYDGDEWHQEQKLLAEDGGNFDSFGRSLQINEDFLVVGAPGNLVNRGAAYIFEFDGEGWSQRYKLVKGDQEGIDPDEFSQARFGNSVAMDKNIALIGSFEDKENGIQSGSAYLYEFIAQPGQLTAGDGESGNLVRISWNNRSNNVEGFKIYRDGIEIGSTVLAAAVFIDFGAIAGKIHAYEVSVYNNFWGESPRTMANFGWKRANGRISGKVQTDRGLEIAEVETPTCLATSASGNPYLSTRLFAISTLTCGIVPRLLPPLSSLTETLPFLHLPTISCSTFFFRSLAL